MVKVKICGITNLDDALCAVRAGADALGFVFANSPRRVGVEAAAEIIGKLPPFVHTVGVFLDQSVAEVARIRSFCGLEWVQLHGKESEEQAEKLEPGVIKAMPARPGMDVDRAGFLGMPILLDAWSEKAAGGTGKTCDWESAEKMARKRLVILAGGLGPENITEAVETVRPYAVDASSGLEMEPGRKDHDKICKFIARAKRA